MKRLVVLLCAALLLAGCISSGAQPTATPAASPAVIQAATPTPDALQSLISASKTPSVIPSPTGEKNVNPTIVENGDLVAVDYLGTFDNGTAFDTSIEAEAKKAGLPLRESYAPLEFTVGAGQMIKGFDSGVLGMKVGEEKNIHLSPAEAYGERSEENVVNVSRSKIDGEGLEVGSSLYSSSGAKGTVTAITNDTVTVDFNSQMAGKALNFKIILRKLTKGTG